MRLYQVSLLGEVKLMSLVISFIRLVGWHPAEIERPDEMKASSLAVPNENEWLWASTAFLLAFLFLKFDLNGYIYIFFDEKYGTATLHKEMPSSKPSTDMHRRNVTNGKQSRSARHVSPTCGHCLLSITGVRAARQPLHPGALITAPVRPSAAQSAWRPALTCLTSGIFGIMFIHFF